MTFNGATSYLTQLYLPSPSAPYQIGKSGKIESVSLMAARYFTKGGTPEKAYAYMKKEGKGKCKVWLYGWVPATMDLFKKAFKRLKSWGPAKFSSGSRIISIIHTLPSLRRK
jgi:hypothetical protein